MIKNLNYILIISAIVFASMGANAELIATDWENDGDSLSTLDESTGLEWLDLTQTDNQSYKNVSDQLDTNFNGWRFPTEGEILTLFENIAQEPIIIGANNYRNNTAVYNNAVSTTKLFGRTYEDGGNVYLRGAYKADDDSYDWSGITISKNTTYYNLYIYHGQNSYSEYNNNITRGVFLVSDGGTTLSSVNNPSLNINNLNAPINQASVPLTATAFLMGLGLTGLMRRKKIMSY
jgi:hypothetical protein